MLISLLITPAGLSLVTRYLSWDISRDICHEIFVGLDFARLSFNGLRVSQSQSVALFSYWTHKTRASWAEFGCIYHHSSVILLYGLDQNFWINNLREWNDMVKFKMFLLFLTHSIRFCIKRRTFDLLFSFQQKFSKTDRNTFRILQKYISGRVI